MFDSVLAAKERRSARVGRRLLRAFRIAWTWFVAGGPTAVYRLELENERLKARNTSLWGTVFGHRMVYEDLQMSYNELAVRFANETGRLIKERDRLKAELDACKAHAICI